MVYVPASTAKLFRPLQVTQRSLLSSFRAVVVYASFYAVAPDCFGVMRAFMSSFRADLVYASLFCMGVVKHAVSSFI